MFCLCKDSTDGSGVMGRVGGCGGTIFFLAVERSSIFSFL